MYDGEAVVCLPDVVSPAEIAQLVKTGIAAAQGKSARTQGAGCVRMHVPAHLPKDAIHLCDTILRRVLALIDNEFPSFSGAVGGGAAAALAELHDLGELEFSENEPAINVYRTGGEFTPHQDGCALTVLIPLSSPSDGSFAGGGTGFWASAEDASPSLVLKPPAGTAMLFTGAVTHAGMIVESGRRLVLVASFSLKGTDLLEAEELREDGERVLRRVYRGGQVQYYAGERGVERLLRVSYADGTVEHYEGAQGEERMTRAVLPNGDIENHD
jgi:hypothetical protein